MNTQIKLTNKFVRKTIIRYKWTTRFISKLDNKDTNKLIKDIIDEYGLASANYRQLHNHCAIYLYGRLFVDAPKEVKEDFINSIDDKTRLSNLASIIAFINDPNDISKITHTLKDFYNYIIDTFEIKGVIFAVYKDKAYCREDINTLNRISESLDILDNMVEAFNKSNNSIPSLSKN